MFKEALNEAAAWLTHETLVELSVSHIINPADLPIADQHLPSAQGNELR